MRSCFFSAPAASMSRSRASSRQLRHLHVLEVGEARRAGRGCRGGGGHVGSRGGGGPRRRSGCGRPREEAGGEAENVFAPARRVNEARRGPRPPGARAPGRRAAQEPIESRSAPPYSWGVTAEGKGADPAERGRGAARGAPRRRPRLLRARPAGPLRRGVRPAHARARRRSRRRTRSSPRPTRPPGASPGRPRSRFARVVHREPMLSLGNVTTDEELDEFDARVRRLLGLARRGRGRLRRRAQARRPRGGARLRGRRASSRARPAATA